MGKPKDPAFVKTLPDEAGVSAPDASRSSDDLDLAGLEALREKLVTLRAEDTGLDKLELTSLRALVAYTAHDRGVNETVVRTLVEKHFGVDDITKIPSKNYEAVIRFLVGMNVKNVMN
jgi:hypothetical protein